MMTLCIYLIASILFGVAVYRINLNFVNKIQLHFKDHMEEYNIIVKDYMDARVQHIEQLLVRYNIDRHRVSVEDVKVEAPKPVVRASRLKKKRPYRPAGWKHSEESRLKMKAARELRMKGPVKFPTLERLQKKAASRQPR